MMIIWHICFGIFKLNVNTSNKISFINKKLFLDIYLVNFIWVNWLYIHKRVSNEEYNHATMVTGGWDNLSKLDHIFLECVCT